MPNFYEKFDFDAIFDFYDFQKGILWTTFSPKVSTFAVTFSWFGRPCRDPAFYETIIITVPFGPTGFQKVICSMEIGSFSVLFCFSLC